MRNELPQDGDWDAVKVTVNARMRELGMSLAALSRESGVSETSIRYMYIPGKRHKSTLVAISAALDWPHDYLVDVLNRRGTIGGPVVAPDTAEVLAEVHRMGQQILAKLDRL